jgi:hypothetical protein
MIKCPSCKNKNEEKIFQYDFDEEGIQFMCLECKKHYYKNQKEKDKIKE